MPFRMEPTTQRPSRRSHWFPTRWVLTLTLMLATLLWPVATGRASGEQLNVSPWNREPTNDSTVNSLWSVWYGGGMFLASVGDGTMFVSTGGEWRREKLVPAVFPNDMVYVDDRFIGVGNQPDHQGGFMTSSNGTEWAVQPIPGEDTPFQIVYGDGLFAAISSRAVYTSADAVTWQRHELPIAPTLSLKSIVHGNGQFVALASEAALPTNPIAYHVALISQDGTEWVQHPMGELVPLSKAAFGANRFVMAGLRNTILTSDDGVTWVERRGGAPNNWISDVAFGGDRFVATSRFGHVLISTDGTTWAEQTVEGAGDFYGVAYGSGQFVMSGNTPDLYTWKKDCGAFFTDVMANDPACTALAELSSYELVNGFPDGTFRPLAPIMRAEISKLLTLLLGLQPDPATASVFSDTAGHWVVTAGFLQPLVKAGIVAGFPDGTFRPEQPVSRAELVSLVVAAAGVEPSSLKPLYEDVTESQWYYDPVAAALAGHLIGSEGAYPVWTEPILHGSESATRAEATALLANLIARQR